ncbi:MAG: 4Fe-4S dicluster domain-containing protein [Candidatus Eisenbacteria bacterium]|nr:4Fe-4S dicluster domain-containing protein [Candidatus Eisenbacteria bacterium]
MSGEPLHRAQDLNWFDDRDAPARADLRTCIHCGLCLTACPTYRTLKLEPDSPRGRLYLMRGLAEGRIAPSHPLLEHLDNCLACRACETVCPAGVPYGRLLEESRAQLERRAVRPTLARRLGRWALRTLFPDRGRMHLAADLLRLGQSAPLAALLRWALARRLLPRFAVRGWELTPPIAPRRERALERVADSLPPGATMETRAGALVFHPAGVARARVAFFTSCVMETMFPHTNHDAVRLLLLAGCEVTVPQAQTCCGALHAHAGLRDEARALARANVQAFEPGGCDFVVTDSAGCGAALRESGHLLREDTLAGEAAGFAARVRDISEVLARLGLPEPVALHSARDPAKPLRVGYHDPCHLAHAQGVRNAPRALLRRIPGVELVELPDSDWCCGSAGVYNLTHPEMAEAQLEQKLDSIAQVAPEVVVAANPGCLLHMTRGARARGLDARMVHLVEVLAEAYPAPRSAGAPHA